VQLLLQGIYGNFRAMVFSCRPGIVLLLSIQAARSVSSSGAPADKTPASAAGFKKCCQGQESTNKYNFYFHGIPLPLLIKAEILTKDI